MPLSHVDSEGNATMVDVGDKAVTERTARARGRIGMSAEAFEAIMEGRIVKGNVLNTARVAGIMAGKNTAAVIPLCHPLPIAFIGIEFYPDQASCSIEAEATIKLTGRTGAEMEAIHAVSVALITIYDMAKAVDKAMVIADIRLMEKSGGKSGTFTRP